jgi:hypothetical protein
MKKCLQWPGPFSGKKREGQITASNNNAATQFNKKTVAKKMPLPERLARCSRAQGGFLFF